VTTHECAQAYPKTPTIACHNLLASFLLGGDPRQARATHGHVNAQAYDIASNAIAIVALTTHVPPKQAPSSARVLATTCWQAFIGSVWWASEAPRQAQVTRGHVNAQAYDIASNASAIVALTTHECAQACPKTPTLACHNLLASFLLGGDPRQARATHGHVNAQAYDIASNVIAIVALTTHKHAQASPKLPTLACHNLLTSTPPL